MSENEPINIEVEKPARELRGGWTTGACATAATKSALHALVKGDFLDPVEITLPKGDKPSFALTKEETGNGYASASIIKDAGDDPDVTHLAIITSTVRRSESGIIFRAGKGVGTVTKAGLPINVGQAAINPVPRKLMTEVIEAFCRENNILANFEITISVPGGEKLAKKTWNPRLGILGGISILGTTGVVHPFSCSAWIHSIHRGIDVSRANNINHVLGATGSTSEKVAQNLYNFPDEAMLDMGDFAGGLLKYLRANPIDKLTLAGGFAKFTKLAQGAMDLHSGRSQIDMDWLAEQAIEIGADMKIANEIRSANTALEALQIAEKAKLPLPSHIALRARNTVKTVLRTAPVSVEILIISRTGEILARTDWSE
ncbi:MAG: cobalt-precorrin-5B (C(1))-methyltransferase [Rhizobiaceae bacterium]